MCQAPFSPAQGRAGALYRYRERRLMGGQKGNLRRLQGYLDDARARGVTVCLPCVTDADGPLTFRVAWSAAGDQPLVAGVWGIEEPSADLAVSCAIASSVSG